MRKQILLPALAVLAGFNAFSQVDIDKSINLSNTAPADAKITGIKQVSAAQDAVSVEYLQRGASVYAIATGTGPAYAVNLSPAITIYTDGMEVRFRAPVDNAAGVTLDVNGVGALPIKKNVSSNLAANDITAGQLVSVIYDTASDVFQLASRIEQLSNTTAPGTYNNVTVNSQGLVTSGSNVSYAPASAVSGGLNFIPKFTSTTAIGNSVIQENSGNIGIGAAGGTVKLKVAGDIEANNQIRATGWLAGTGTGHGMEVGVASGIGYLLSYDRTAAAYKPARLVGSTIEFRHSDASTDLFINTSGQVGIANGAPLTPLHISGALLSSFTGTSKGTLTIDAPYSAGGFSAIDFPYTSGNHPNARIAVQPNGFGTKMMFGTSNNYASGVTNTALTIDHNGKVGIGNTGPTATLHVNGDLVTQNGRVKRDFLVWNTVALGSTPVHIKTNITFTDIMYRFLVEGYNYDLSQAINSEAVGYAYSSGAFLNTATYNRATGATLTQYKSSDGYVVLKLTMSSTYYMGFSVSGWFVNPTPGAAGWDVQATVYHQVANL